MRPFSGLVLVASGLALAGCAALAPAGQATFTPFPFVTASPRPPATAPEPSATEPPTLTLTSSRPVATLHGSPIASTFGPQDTATFPATATLPGVTGECASAPQGGFGVIWNTDPGLRPALGCPLSQSEEAAPQAWIVETVWQPFERGWMLWASALGWDLSRPVVYAVYADDGTFERFDDAYVEGVEPTGEGLTPPASLFEPTDSLGKVWREGPGVRERLGWATGPRVDEFTYMQVFANGEMIYVVPTGSTLSFKQGIPNTWLEYDVKF